MVLTNLSQKNMKSKLIKKISKSCTMCWIHDIVTVIMSSWYLIWHMPVFSIFIFPTLTFDVHLPPPPPIPIPLSTVISTNCMCWMHCSNSDHAIISHLTYTCLFNAHRSYMYSYIQCPSAPPPPFPPFSIPLSSVTILPQSKRLV